MPLSQSIKDAGEIDIAGRTISFTISRSAKRKRTIAFKIGTNSNIVIISPLRTSKSQIENILKKRSAWIVRELGKPCKHGKQADFSDGSVFPYMGHACCLRIVRGGKDGSCRLSPRVLHVHVPDESLSPKGLRQEARLEVLLWVKKRARTKFKKRADLWARKMGVNYKKIIVADASKRWGSCSVDNVIRLNWRLMLLPLPVLDYVVAHELSHIAHKNHSSLFWGFLSKFMPDYKERRGQLRGQERGILSSFE